MNAQLHQALSVNSSRYEKLLGILRWLFSQKVDVWRVQSTPEEKAQLQVALVDLQKSRTDQEKNLSDDQLIISKLKGELNDVLCSFDKCMQTHLRSLKSTSQRLDRAERNKNQLKAQVSSLISWFFLLWPNSLVQLETMILNQNSIFDLATICKFQFLNQSQALCSSLNYSASNSINRERENCDHTSYIASPKWNQSSKLYSYITLMYLELRIHSNLF